MGKFDQVPYVIEIKSRMRGLGVDLDLFIDDIANHWPKPRGFNFVLSPDKMQQLRIVLQVNHEHFAQDSSLSRRIRQTLAYREISKTDGIHITFVPGAPYDGYSKPVNWHINIHLDSVSLCPAVNHLPGRDKQVCSITEGEDLIEDLSRVGKHIKHDLLNK